MNYSFRHLFVFPLSLMLLSGMAAFSSAGEPPVTPTGFSVAVTKSLAIAHWTPAAGNPVAFVMDGPYDVIVPGSVGTAFISHPIDIYQPHKFYLFALSSSGPSAPAIFNYTPTSTPVLPLPSSAFHVLYSVTNRTNSQVDYTVTLSPGSASGSFINSYGSDSGSVWAEPTTKAYNIVVLFYKQNGATNTTIVSCQAQTEAGILFKTPKISATLLRAGRDGSGSCNISLPE